MNQYDVLFRDTVCYHIISIMQSNSYCALQWTRRARNSSDSSSNSCCMVLRRCLTLLFEKVSSTS